MPWRFSMASQMSSNWILIHLTLSSLHFHHTLERGFYVIWNVLFHKIWFKDFEKRVYSLYIMPLLTIWHHLTPDSSFDSHMVKRKITTDICIYRLKIHSNHIYSIFKIIYTETYICSYLILVPVNITAVVSSEGIHLILLLQFIFFFPFTHTTFEFSSCATDLILLNTALTSVTAMIPALK